MRVTFASAIAADAGEITALRNAVSDDLTTSHGRGPWSRHCTVRGVLYDRCHSHVFVARSGGRLVATLVLAHKKPWAIDRSHFTQLQRPLYLLSMAVSLDLQRRGIGRSCLDHAITAARELLADAIFLDAFDAKAGAGEFYRQCGFREVGRAVYRGVPLIYFEQLIVRTT
ncbi:MAG: GNAT family N-acetyltransferase [Verrucomicrobiota bacterium]